MALRVIHFVFVDSGKMPNPNATLHAGMVAALTTDADGLPVVTPAVRGTHAIGAILGFAGDDATVVGNTQAIVNPVTLEYEAHPARRLGDLQDETIKGFPTNWTDTGTVARRGVTIFSGGEYQTDQYVSDASANGANTDAGAAPSFTPGDLWTYGASANAGLLIDDGEQTLSQSLPAVAVLIATESNDLITVRWQPVF